MPACETASLAALRQELEEAKTDDSALLRRLWHLATGGLPPGIDSLIRRHGFLDAVLDLAEARFGAANIEGWTLSYTSAGGPYSATIHLRDGSRSATFDGRSSYSAAAALGVACLAEIEAGACQAGPSDAAHLIKIRN